MHFLALFHTAPLSNLRPFGAPPSIGRRECPREPLPLEGAAERSEAGLASFWGGEAASSLPSPFGERNRAAVDRVLSQTAYLRRSPSLFFIPPEPYPARSARHLPHAGKALAGTAALSQMPCFHSAQTKTALRGRALQSGFWFYYSTVTDFARFLGLSTSFPLLIEV